MIFALIDYLTYMRRSGRFSRNVKKSVMAGGFQGDVPVKAIELLRSGDVLLVQTLDSPISWLIMHLTTSEISHVAHYYGNGQIVHATTTGMCIDPVESLFNQSTRVLLTQWNISDEQRAQMTENLQALLGTKYGWSAVLLKGFLILSARDWPYFRWRFFADIALALFLLDLPAILLLGYPVLSWLIPCYLTLIVFHGLLWKVKPLNFTEWTVKPCDMLSVILRSGGTLMFDAYYLTQQLEENPRSAL